MLRTRCRIGVVVLGLVIACEHRSEKPQVSAHPAELSVPSGFQDQIVLANLTQPTAVRFAKDGRIFIAEKSGLVKVYDPARAPEPEIFADLRSNVHNYWDRGLLDLALHPDFPATPFVYVLYTYDAALGAVAPRWGSAAATADRCPTPPGPTDQGCVVSGRLSRLEAGDAGMRGLEQVLIENWPQQFPSHSVGSLQFGADGMLYVSAGDGASFEFVDYGQVGDPPNPLGDPPLAAGGQQTPPTARGGALRAQNVAVSGFAPRFNGKVLRIDPLTGLPAPGNPLAGDAAAIVASGLRNPYRMTFRPGTNELWIGDVGWGEWEEIDRLVDPLGPTVENFGWPCFEGAERQPGYEAAGLSACDALYASDDHVPAFFAYRHLDEVVAGDGCGTGQAAVTGLAFYTDGLYPAEYRGALFFADYSRNCIWVMLPGADGLPSPQTRRVFAQGAPQPVQLLIGPGNDLYYTSLESGTLHRIAALGGNRPPLAKIAVSRSGGAVPLTVAFDAEQSSDPDPGDTLTYAWDLDGDGAFDDASGPTAEFLYASAGERSVGLRVSDSRGAVAVAQQTIMAGADGSGLRATIAPIMPEQFRVGETLSFSGEGLDGDQPLPAADLQWDLVVEHCPVVDQCHPHLIESFEGVDSGTFTAPEHDYPYYLELILRVSSPDGRQATALARLDPVTADLTLDSDPPGVLLAFNQAARAAPFAARVVVGSQNTLSAPDYPGYTFVSWSDGGAQAHLITVSQAQSVRATYRMSSVAAQLKHAGTPIARVTAPVGGGNPSLEVIRDEDYPPPGTADSQRQYDTLSPELGPKDDWIGYAFGGLHAFSRLQFQEGRNFVDGGWFERVRVRVRRDGVWQEVAGSSTAPPYPGRSDSVGFRSYRFDFENTIGDAIQVYGPAGGSAYFTSTAELDVFGWRAIASPSATPLAQLAAAPALILSGEEVTLDGRASFDPNGEPLEYGWTQSAGPSVTLVDADTAQPHFSAPSAAAAVDLTFVLTVRAGTRSSAAVSRTFRVTPLTGPVDLSSRGRISISEPAPFGGGTRDLEVIRDGIEPPPGSTDYSTTQWDTFAADPTVIEGWVGYEFDESYRFGRLRFQEGGDFVDGGWFNALGVEVRRAGHWLPVQSLRSTPAYPAASDGIGFQVYELQFTPALGDAIRLIGPPGGSAHFFSVAELRPFAVPAPATDAAPSANAGPDFDTSSGATVSLDASRSIDSEGAALSYEWQQVSGPSVSLSSVDVAAPTFQAPSVRVTTELIFSLTVRDETRASEADRVSVIVDPPRTPLDVTSYASIIASVRFPYGLGSPDLEVIRDGVVPVPGDTNTAVQYDTFTGQLTSSGFIGYQFTAQSQLTFARLTFQEGLHFPNGGWFKALGVEVRRSGEWQSVSDLMITPSYFGDGSGPGFQTYTLDFRPTVGDAIRLIGPPGGDASFFSVAELRAFAL